MVSCSKAVLKVLHCILAIGAIHSWFYINSFMKIYVCTYNFAQIYNNWPNFLQPQGQLIQWTYERKLHCVQILENR